MIIEVYAYVLVNAQYYRTGLMGVNVYFRYSPGKFGEKLFIEPYPLELNNAPAACFLYRQEE